MTHFELNGKCYALDKNFLDRYNRQGPRYTSYPTAPEWREPIAPEQYAEILREKTRNPKDYSLYVHIPFCERACYFCGCNTVITEKREVADCYLNALEKEIDQLSGALGERKKVVQLQCGGGTPTYLSPAQLERVFKKVHRHFDVDRAGEVAVEVHPNVTSDEQLETLRSLGFNRLSMGVQDFDPAVQRAVNRIEHRARVETLTAFARKIGFQSINIDLIYGLPHQTVATFEKTIDAIVEISPDRIALFNYAHVPWMKPFQKWIREADLPDGSVKFDIFRMSIRKLTEAGYRYIGLDHFAKPGDELCVAQTERTLKRNFMGYTTHAGTYMLGLGESAIGMLDDIYIQNEKKLARYEQMIEEEGFATTRGIRLSPDDLIRREVIMNVLCHTALSYGQIERAFDIVFEDYFAEELSALPAFEADGLMEVASNGFSITPLGRILIRNIAMTFDAHLKKPAAMPRVFSKTV